jgi:hypothetical protein
VFKIDNSRSNGDTTYGNSLINCHRGRNGPQERCATTPGVGPASILAGGKGGVGSHKQGRFVLTDPILRKENDGRPTGKGVAGTVTPGNIEVENTSTGVGLAGAAMP